MAGPLFINLAARDDNDYRGLFSPDEYRTVSEFYRRGGDLQSTPLHSLQQLAAEHIDRHSKQRVGVWLKEAHMPMVIVAIGTGIRRGDLFNLTWGRIDSNAD